MAELAGVVRPRGTGSLLLERRQVLADAALELQRSTCKARAKNLPSWSLGIAGASCSATAGHLIGTVLADAGLIPGVLGSIAGGLEQRSLHART